MEKGYNPEERAKFHRILNDCMDEGKLGMAILVDVDSQDAKNVGAYIVKNQSNDRLNAKYIFTLIEALKRLYSEEAGFNGIKNENEVFCH